MAFLSTHTGKAIGMTCRRHHGGRALQPESTRPFLSQGRGAQLLPVHDACAFFIFLMCMCVQSQDTLQELVLFYLMGPSD